MELALRDKRRISLSCKQDPAFECCDAKPQYVLLNNTELNLFPRIF